MPSINANLEKSETKWWDSWSDEKKAKYDEWLKGLTNSGGEHTDQKITNNDEETLRTLFDMGLQDQDMPESSTYGTEEPLFGYPTPEANSTYGDLNGKESYFVSGSEDVQGAYKYDAQGNAANEFRTSSGEPTNWTGNPQDWANHKIVGDK
jgi:hypothetical protein